ncbi:AAA family ATPase [Elstera cyanobacteriorum]|uniref:AAA family ATPase n=1 Tax=Elstera cyanobacteriorum TaxID=2022747 RepID=UPI002357B37C|nr:AAA family ATPase [Elstera cyanobacteriorum]MCK6442317.1 AAA family ATPase [Elstera cyanobacteriorum]
MRLMIQNFGSLERADVTLSDKITLIAGPNAVGKSTTARALGMLLAGVTIPEGMLKKNSADLVREGQDGASIALVVGEGQHISITYPAAQRATAGSDLPYASNIAAGLTSWESLKPDERARLLADLLKTAPTREDLIAALADCGVSDREADALWNDVQSIGWENTEKSQKDTATKAKGAWERVTGERFGSSKAAIWRPANWTPDLMEATEASLKAAEKRAQEERDKAVAGAAVDSAKLEELRAKAAGLAEAQSAVLDAKDALSKAEHELTKAESDQQALPLIDTGNSVPCPHCGSAVLAEVHHRTRELRLAKAEVLPDAEIKSRQMAKASADGAVENRRSAVNAARTALSVAEARQREAETAAHELAQAEGRSGSLDAVTKATDALNTAKARLKAWADANAAKAEYQKFARADAVAKILSDTGVRKAKLQKVLEMFADSYLAPLCDGAKWKRVEIAPDLSPTYGGRAWPVLSESERYRVEIILRIALATLDGSAMVIIDCADRLDQHQRNGLFAMLKRLEDLPAVVCMTARREAVPNLAARNLGASYWIEDGTATPIADAAQQAA